MSKNKINDEKTEITKENIELNNINKEDILNNGNIKKQKNVTTLQENEPTTDKEEIEENDAQETKMLRKHKVAWTVGIIIAIVLIIVLLFSTVFGIINKYSDKIISGVSINNIDISNMTKYQATTKLKEAMEEKLTKKMKLFKGEYKLDFSLQEIDADYKIEEAIEKAYSIGRQGKILKNNFEAIDTYFNNKDISIEYSFNEDKLNEIINATSENIPQKMQESGYYIQDNSLIISKGKRGLTVDSYEFKKRITNCLKDILNSNMCIEIPTLVEGPQSIDIEKLHNEVYKEAKNAYYTKNPFVVYPHEDGVDFDISIDEAKNLLLSQEEQISIPLKLIHPEITTNQIGTEAFPDLLATFSTTFSTKNSNRTTNIKLASNKIDGVVLLPGQEFSYNQVVGQRTAAAGFKSAAVYVNGRVENGIGGGICQVSSTLYNTALRANLEIIKRSNHRFATGYVPLSTDATVSWGGPEFIFKNSRKYPIKILSIVNGGRITVQIFGCKEEVEYDVEIKSETLQTIASKTTYRVNTALPQGTSRKVQSGHGGYKSRAYRILRLNGNVISKELLSNDTYAQLETIIEHNP